MCVCVCVVMRFTSLKVDFKFLNSQKDTIYITLCVLLSGNVYSASYSNNNYTVIDY